MNDFYYYLTVFNEKTCNWDRIFQDHIEACDKKDAVKKIEELHKGKIKQKVSRGKESEVDFKVFVIEMDSKWKGHWLGDRTCKRCNSTYQMITIQQMRTGGGSEYCSSLCRDEARPNSVLDLKTDGIHPPVIYKITYKPTNQVYIGQTTQAFTLRWYQHFFCTTKTRFHKMIESTELTDWSFEVIETLKKSASKDEINERERQWIIHYDSVNTGFNSVNFQEKIVHDQEEEDDFL
jgi:hypothetical protein